MHFSRIFIHRPVLAMVISILITLAGAVSLLSLPVEQYPNITPPTVQVSAVYTGASADVVEQSVAIPIEQAVNGAQNMLYMSSRSTNSGSYSLTCTFAVGTDVDIAAVDVQNRVQEAQGNLPSEVITTGITVRKRSPSMLMMVTLYSPDSSYDQLFLSNYAAINMLDPLSRVFGVGDTMQIGQEYSMRLWLQPDRMAGLGITASDVVAAVRQQNVQAPAGQIGAPPAPAGTNFQYSVLAQGQLALPEQYQNIIVRSLPDGSILRLRDIGRTQLGSETYSTFSRLNGLPASTIIIYQLPTANALATANGVRQALDQLSRSFPAGVAYKATMDSTLFVNESIKEVVKTLFEAIGLVMLVVYLFLGNLRATLIPMLAVPVSLVGTFAAFLVLGFSINTLTLFGLVLVIGLVVDDAIVVVEAVEHNIEEGMAPLEATERAMDEVGGALVAIALVLTSVFVPVAFMSGITGQLYRQFALTLAVSIAISALVALTLSPALCAMLLRHRRRSRSPVAWAIGKFNASFDRLTAAYVGATRRFIRIWPAAVLGLFLILGCIWLLINKLPTGFVPTEDQGYFFIAMNLPDGASLQRTDEVARKAEAIVRKLPGVEDVTTIGGFSFLTLALQSNNASLVIRLKPWAERLDAGLPVQAILRRAAAGLSGIPEALVIPFIPPPIPGLGVTGGFQIQIEDRAGTNIGELDAAAQKFSTEATQRPELTGVFNTFRTNVPQIKVDLDRDKTNTLGIPVSSVFDSLQTLLGGVIVNNFNRFGRVYRVMMQAEPQYRDKVGDITGIYVRTSAGQMVPLSTLLTVERTTGPDIIQRFNLYRAAEITGSPATGYSSGQALEVAEELAKSVLPAGMGYDWAGVSYQERAAAGTQAPILLLAFAFVFLFLAAQYESWIVPLAVIFGVPLGVLGAYTGIWLRGLINDVYVQIGVVMLIGLTAKNAILIVEFAASRWAQGRELADAALEAARLRFRPIVMTSLAFILGLLPLMFASGAGSASRHSLGTAVVAGMTSATLLEVFFIPIFYVLIGRIAGRLRRSPAPVPAPAGPPAPAPEGRSA
ncbi:MAG TPA: multidrug efflux RND transporter permease subunit [Bryobacteraceae bacterium]|nr:multidrug efflux RND transporter permease subunit [Bryobacteraceae bacterium]